MTAWFLLFNSIHGSLLLAGAYPTQARCQQDQIIVETFIRELPTGVKAKCVERPAALAPGAP